MSTSLIGWIWKYPKLSSTERYVLLALNERVAWHDFRRRWECYPSYEYVAKMCGLSRRTVLRSINKMAEIGVLTIEPRYDDLGRQRNNNFVINAPPLMGELFDEPAIKAQPDAPDSGGDKMAPHPEESAVNTSPEPPEAVRVTDCHRGVSNVHPHEPQGLEPEKAQVAENPAEGGCHSVTGGGDTVSPNSLSKYSSTTTATTRGREFAMTVDWQPLDTMAGRCTMMGIPWPDNFVELLGEFKSFRMTRGEQYTQDLWEHKLAQHLSRHKHDPKPAPVTDQRDFVEKHTDQSWREGL